MKAAEYEMYDLLTDKNYRVNVTETYDSRSYQVFWERKDGDSEIVAHLFVPRKGVQHDRLALSLAKSAVDMHNREESDDKPSTVH